MSRNGQVIVAMSGGVDSSVAACLLKDQGYAPIGVFMWVGRGAEQSIPADRERRELPQAKQGCCSIGDACDAKAVASRLGIPFYSMNFQEDFGQIIEYFVDEYARARTPNPCVICNTRIKFGKLLAYADVRGAEYIATGHYARVLRGSDAQGACPSCVSSTAESAPHASDGEPVFLARSVNIAKDQSYALFGIRRGNLHRCLFPVGAIADKAEVRRIASGLGLDVHDKRESQEICFVPDDDYKQLVRSRRPETEQPGDVRDSAGQLLGTHTGIVNYTIGQRRGLRIAAGHPIYVTRLDAATNTVTVGSREELLSTQLVAEGLNWLTDPPEVDAWRTVQIKIRYQHTPVAGRIVRRGTEAVEAVFDEPQPAVTPGQAAVFYDGEIVLGGGWISSPAS